MAELVRVFISYSSKDADLVDRLKTALARAGVDVWLDHEQLTPGTPNWQIKVREGIAQATTVVYVASETAAASAYVYDEISVGRNTGKAVIPFWARGVEWHNCAPLGFGATQYIDGRGTAYASGVARLLAALGVAPAAPAPAAAQQAQPNPPSPNAGVGATGWTAIAIAAAQAAEEQAQPNPPPPVAQRRGSHSPAVLAAIRALETQPNSQAATVPPASGVRSANSGKLLGTTLVAQSREIDLGRVLRGQDATATLTISRADNAAINGTLKSLAPWLHVDPTSFNGVSALVEVTAHTSEISGYGPQRGTIEIAIGAQRMYIPVRLEVVLGPFVSSQLNPKQNP